MTYLEIMRLRENYCDHALIAILSILFYTFIALIICWGIAFFNPVIAAKLIIVISIVLITNTIPILLCGTRIYLYLSDEMKKIWMKGTDR